MMMRQKSVLYVLGVLLTAGWALTAPGQASNTGAITYLETTVPRQIDLAPQLWEGDQQPHTLSVVEMNRGGFKYWGWYGLNAGRGMGLARSNDLLHWTKYEQNPLWTNARWPTVLKGADPKHPNRLYFAITRNYDTVKQFPQPGQNSNAKVMGSYIVLAESNDGIHLKETKVLVKPAIDLRNQNPDLFHDPKSGFFYLTFYRGNDIDSFDIVSKHAARIADLDKAPERVLMHAADTLAAPDLFYVAHAGPQNQGIYYLATEIDLNRYGAPSREEWQTAVFASESPDGDFKPVAGNPVFKNDRACLFQHELDGKYYGFMSHLDHITEQWVMEEVEAPLPK